MGYIEPCGCSGKENQKGGLSRRDNFLKKLRTDGWDVVPLDVGGQILRFGKQAELKFQATADALKTMKYRAVAFGADDLRLPAEALTAAAAETDPGSSPFVGANVALFDFDQKLTPRFRIITAGKQKFGVTAILGDSYQKSLASEELKFKPAAAALKEVLPELKAAHCDHLILLANATIEETTALAKQFPEFELVVTSGGAAEPPREPQTIEGTQTRLIEVGQKGMYANVIGLSGDPHQPFLFRKVALGALGRSGRNATDDGLVSRPAQRNWAWPAWGSSRRTIRRATRSSAPTSAASATRKPSRFGRKRRTPTRLRHAREAQSFAAVRSGIA